MLVVFVFVFVLVFVFVYVFIISQLWLCIWRFGTVLHAALGCECLQAVPRPFPPVVAAEDKFLIAFGLIPEKRRMPEAAEVCALTFSLT